MPGPLCTLFLGLHIFWFPRKFGCLAPSTNVPLPQFGNFPLPFSPVVFLLCEFHHCLQQRPTDKLIVNRRKLFTKWTETGKYASAITNKRNKVGALVSIFHSETLKHNYKQKKHSLRPLTLSIRLAQAYAMAHSAAKRMERVKVNLIMKLTL